MSHKDVRTTMVSTRVLSRGGRRVLSPLSGSLSRAKTHGGTIYPGDPRLVMTVDYRVDDAIFGDQRGLFDQKVTATAFVHGELAATAERLLKEMQMF